MRLWPIAPVGNPQVDELQAAVAAHEVVRQVVEATQALYARKGHAAPWLGYLAAQDGQWVGTCGFVGPPVRGEVEIAYFSFPGHEGRGVATAMAHALLALAAGAGYQDAIVAHTLPHAGASTALLTRLGFECLGEWPHPEDGLVWKWRMRRA